MAYLKITNPALRLHMKDTPSHRRSFHTHNLNGTDLNTLRTGWVI